MTSIREICSSVHTQEEISGWGYREFKPEGWKSCIESDREHIWVVEVDGAVEGYGQISLKENHLATITGLYLSPKCAGQGIGNEHIQILINKAKETSVTRIDLDSSLNAQNFYQRNGFKPIKETKCRIGSSDVRGILMELTL